MKQYKPKHINITYAVQFWPSITLIYKNCIINSEISLNGEIRYYIKCISQGRDFGRQEIKEGDYILSDPVLGYSAITRNYFEETYEEIKD